MVSFFIVLTNISYNVHNDDFETVHFHKTWNRSQYRQKPILKGKSKMNLAIRKIINSIFFVGRADDG